MNVYGWLQVFFNSWIFYGGNLALMMNDVHISTITLIVQLSLLGQSHFSSPVYLTLKAWINNEYSTVMPGINKVFMQ